MYGIAPGQSGKSGQSGTRQALSSLAVLSALPFPEFARVVADLLTDMGYEDVRVTGRAAGRGRNGTGGYDLECFVSDGLKRRRVIVLLKQFGTKAWVFQRMVDELRGVAVREGADEAILITTGKLSPVIAHCEGVGGVDPALRTLPPVERIGGDQLRWLLAAYGVNVNEKSSDTRRSPENDGRASSPVPPTRRRKTLLQPGGEPAPSLCGIVLELEVRVTIPR